MTAAAPSEAHTGSPALDRGAPDATGDGAPVIAQDAPVLVPVLARADLRLVPPAAAAWGAAWIAPLVAPRLVLSLAAIAAGLAAWCAWWGLRNRLRSTFASGTAAASGAMLLAAVTLICAAATATGSALRVTALTEPRLAALAAAGASAEAELVVTRDPRRVAPRKGAGGAAAPMVLVRARLERVEARGGRLAVRAPILVIADERWATLLPGQRVAAVGRLRPAERGDDIAAVLLARNFPEVIGNPGAVQTVAGGLRAGLREAAEGLPADERGLLPGLVVGDTSAMPPSLEADFRTAGLTHLTAVSGANVAIVVGAVLFAGRGAGLPLRAVPVVAVLSLVGFVILARPDPSVLRAGAMGLIGILALAAGRRRAGVPALCAAALALLLLDPWLARSYGFILSVLATGALLLLAPPWAAALERYLPRPLAQAIAVPAAAQAVCSPVLVVLSGEVSLVSVPANLLVAPAVAPATVLGVLTAVVAPVSETAAELLARLAGIPVGWIVTVGREAAQAPYAATGWPGGAGGALLLAALLAALVIGVRMLARLPPRWRTAALMTAVALGLIVAVPAVVRPGWPPPGWVLVACDVGQGDALVLAAGPGSAVVVDAGPDPDAVDRCLRDLDVRRVPALILTHLHADHAEGMPGVLRGRTVAEVAVGPVDEPVETWSRVQTWARGAGLQPVRARAGDVRSVGPMRWRVLWPQRVIRGEESVPNNASLVLLVEVSGLRLLLTGDVEPTAQRALRRTLDGPVDVLKVPHHGSAHQDPELFALARPRLALVSVGEDNDYGHPAASTVAALESLGAAVMRTDRDGDIAVVGSAGSLRVVGRDG